MDRTLIDLEDLLNAEELTPSAAARRGLLQSVNGTTIKLRPLVATFIEYRGAGEAMFRFPNLDATGRPSEFSTKHSENTWRFVTELLKALKRGTCYHFLCVHTPREDGKKGGNLYPVLLVEAFDPTKNISVESAKLGTLAHNNPADYVTIVAKRNKTYIESISR